MTFGGSLAYGATDAKAETKTEAKETVAEVKKTEVYFSCEQDVYFPKDMKKDKKYPVAFFAHNGGADKSGWGDFPEQVANEGFIAINITWKNWDTSNVEAAISYSLDKYAANIDKDKVVFVGGCHGSKDFLQIGSKENLGYTVKAFVSIGLSEKDESVVEAQKVKHAPILVYYSKNDVLGKDYQAVNKEVAEKIITEPKKVVALDESAHGNDVLTQATCKDQVAKDIIAWIKEYTK